MIYDDRALECQHPALFRYGCAQRTWIAQRGILLLHDAFGYAPVMAIAAGVEIIAMTVMLVGRASKQARDTEFVLLSFDEHSYVQIGNSACFQNAAMSVLRRCVRRSLARAWTVSSAKSLGQKLANS